MRNVLLVIVGAALLASSAQAQVTDQIPNQKAGATDWFGENALRVRGGSRVDIEPANAGHAAVLQMLPDGRLLVRRSAPVEARRQSFEVEGLLRGGEVVRVPFVANCAGGTCPQATGPRAPPPSRAPTPRDAILVILTDVPLDSAELSDRLGHLPELVPDSVASHVAQVLVGRHTAMWASYFQVR